MLLKEKTVRDKVKELYDGKVRVSSDFIMMLDLQVVELIKAAARRCVGNKRGTLQGRDL